MCHRCAAGQIIRIKSIASELPSVRPKTGQPSENQAGGVTPATMIGEITFLRIRRLCAVPNQFGKFESEAMSRGKRQAVRRGCLHIGVITRYSATYSHRWETELII